jgi:hypothetical protein
MLPYEFCLFYIFLLQTHSRVCLSVQAWYEAVEKREVKGRDEILEQRAKLLELMIPPHYRLGSTVVVCPSRFGVVPGSIPSLAILFSSYTNRLSHKSKKFFWLMYLFYNMYISFSVMFTLSDSQPSPSHLDLTVMTGGS